MTRIHVAFVLSLSFLVACGGVADTDEDLLSDNLELLIGTNPEIADSDGDGFTDAVEWLGYYNPMDAEDAPWEGEYHRMPSPSNHPNTDAEIDSNGWDEGDISNNWTLEDRYGDLIDLHDWYGQVVLIDMGAEWCGPCQAAAPAAEEEYQDLKDDGFVVIGLLIEGTVNNTPPDLDRWSDAYDLTYPVVDGFDFDVSVYIESSDGSFGIPNFSVIGRDMEVELIYENPSPTAAIEDAMDEDVPYVEWPLPENAEELRAELGIDLTVDDPHFATNIELGIEQAGAAASGGGGGSSAASGSDGAGGGFTVANSDGSYAGPPWGGASCSASGPTGAGSLLGLLLGLLGLAGIRRR